MALTETFKNILRDRFENRINFFESMAKYTTYGVGGPVDALIFVESIKDIQEVIRLCQGEDLAYFVIGGGSNLLVPDQGVDGVGIHLGRGMDLVELDPVTGMISAGAGCRLGTLRKRAMAAGLGGLEFTIGIPGTVGGAVMMNAGTRDGEMADVVAKVSLVDRGARLLNLDRSELAFGYRRMELPSGVDVSRRHPAVVTGIQFRLTPVDSEALAAKAKRIFENRRASQPSEGRNAGCFFKNPSMGPSAGALIDGVGLKGHRIGGAQISTVHANFIVNTGNASASDIMALARLARDTVADRHGIWLEPEVVILGGADVREKKTAETESEKE